MVLDCISKWLIILFQSAYNLDFLHYIRYGYSNTVQILHDKSQMIFVTSSILFFFYFTVHFFTVLHLSLLLKVKREGSSEEEARFFLMCFFSLLSFQDRKLRSTLFYWTQWHKHIFYFPDVYQLIFWISKYLLMYIDIKLLF